MSESTIVTILGTRPEIIRLSRIIPILDSHANHVLVHTGQNYNERLSDIFFSEMGVRNPDMYLGVKSDTFGGQIGQILERCESVFLKYHPDRLLILGDTNSGLSALVARRLGVPVYHMEAGNRCYDDRVPEEVNRRVIDHSSSVLMPYTKRSKENLLREGIPAERIFVTGNPIMEVIDHYSPLIEQSTIMERLGVEKGRYFLVTMHRAENVDIETRLRNLLIGITGLCDKYDYPVICSVHPRTNAKMTSFGVSLDDSRLRFLEPLGFFDFIKLEMNAFCMLSDSGTVQEEACIFNVPNVTLRDVTERPETIECGSNILSGSEPDNIIDKVEIVTSQKSGWKPPSEYLAKDVSHIVCRVILSYRIPDLSEQNWHLSVRNNSCQ